METGFVELESRVVKRGLCMGCGTCAGICPAEALEMADHAGEPTPQLKGECSSCGQCFGVCPGEDIPLPDLERFVFGRRREQTKADLGIFQSCIQGFAKDPQVRFGGAGGGLATALLLEALRSGWIDGVLAAGFQTGEPWRTKAEVARTASEIKGCAQSKYSPVPVNAGLSEAVNKGCNALAVVGLPCQVHALRKMQMKNIRPDLLGKIKFVIGLFCGGQFYYEGTKHLLQEWCNIEDFREIEKLSYRSGEWPRHFEVRLKDGRTVTLDRHQYTYHFLIPIYKRDRCIMCLDWSNELADLSIGDYWAPSMKPGEEKGHSSCIVRTAKGKEILDLARRNGSIDLKDLDPSVLPSSIGFEFKKHGAAFRLTQRKNFGWPVPDFHYTPDFTPFPREMHLAPERKKP